MIRTCALAVPLLALLCSVTGCPRKAQTVVDTQQEPHIAAEVLVKVRIAVQDKTCYLPVIIAIDQGYFERRGLDVQHLKVVGGIEAAEALVAGSADIAVMGDAPAVIALSRSEKIHMIACQTTGDRMHRIVVRDDSGIKEPADFLGKRLAIQQGSSTHGGFMQYCHKHGVDYNSITVVAISPRDFPEAMVAGQVDFIAGSEPWPGNVLSACDRCHEFANLEGLGSNYPQMILGHESFLRAHPEAVAAIIESTQEAVDFIKAEPERAAEIVSARSGVEVERERKAMADYEYLVGMPQSVVDSMVLTAEFLKEQGKIDTVSEMNARIWNAAAGHGATTEPLQ